MNAQPSMWKGLLLPESKMFFRTRKRSTRPTRVFAASPCLNSRLFEVFPGIAYACHCLSHVRQLISIINIH